MKINKHLYNMWQHVRQGWGGVGDMSQHTVGYVEENLQLYIWKKPQHRNLKDIWKSEIKGHLTL